jgi:hypothetical protein
MKFRNTLEQHLSEGVDERHVARQWFGITLNTKLAYGAKIMWTFVQE